MVKEDGFFVQIDGCFLAVASMLFVSAMCLCQEIEDMYQNTDATAAALVTRYIHRDEEELYDLSADPFERRNLGDAPEFALEKSRLKGRLLLWMRSQGDLGMETELDFERSQKAKWK